MRKLTLLLLLLAPVCFAGKNLLTLSSSAQMQGGNAYPAAVPGSGYSVQGVWTGSSLAGNIALQASLDQATWFTISGSSQAVSGSGSYFWNVAGVNYPWMQLLYTPTSTNAWTAAPIQDPGVAQIEVITAIADTCVAQVQVVTAKADVSGSLNNKYFTISSVNSTTKTRNNMYVWFNVNSAGFDPHIFPTNGVEIDVATNASANTVGGAIGTALAALNTDFASASNSSGAVTITSKKCGAIPAAADGSTFGAKWGATKFTFATPSTLGVNSNLNNKYFLVSAMDGTAKAVVNYYVWFNVSSLGTDPALAGLTAIPVAVTAASSATTVGGVLATALAAVSTSWASASNSSGAVTTTWAHYGAVGAATDSGPAPTGFTFATPSTPGANSLNNTYFVFYATTPTCYYAWFNIDSLGTSPGLASCTAVPITAAKGASASSIGTSLATAIAALDSTNDFTASGTTTVTVTNKAAGPTTFVADHGTGFTFAATTGGGTLSSSISY